MKADVNESHQIVENLPRAARVFAALRNLGYSLNAAVADIVDNSISAEANEVHIDFKRINGKCSLVMSDNGTGMNEKKIIEAMRLGSDSDYQNDDLGKFGMGLKTASLSQCMKLAVASRQSIKEPIFAFCWDIEHVYKTNRWDMHQFGRESIALDTRFHRLVSEPGTIVIWEVMDRLQREIDTYKSPSLADNFFGRVINDMKLHLRMTFHRFLDGSIGNQCTLKIIFNGKILLPWDPFYRDEKNTLTMEAFSLKPEEINTRREVFIQPYILPVKDGEDGFSSLERWNEAKGLLSWNDSQGYYIYRSNRLIHFGGWLRTRAKDEHIKYARIAIDFDKSLDDAFQISVDKTSIQLPSSLFNYLKNIVNPTVVEKAQKPYRATQSFTPAHNKSSRLINRTVEYIMPKRTLEVQTAGGQVAIRNPHGVVRYNSVAETMRINLKERFGIEIGEVPDGRLWRLLCKPDGGFVVLLNKEHEFYKRVYMDNENNSTLVKFIDAVLFSMAYAELYSVSNDTKRLFDEVRDTMSTVLAETSRQDYIVAGIKGGKTSE